MALLIGKMEDSQRGNECVAFTTGMNPCCRASWKILNGNNIVESHIALVNILSLWTEVYTDIVFCALFDNMEFSECWWLGIMWKLYEFLEQSCTGQNKK